MSKNKFYKYGQILSFNSLIHFAMGGRGIGKSYGAKTMMIDNFLNKGKQSVYIRRTTTEIDKIRDNFFSDVKEQYPDTEFDIKGEYGYINGEIAIYFIPLSTSSNRKSVPYPLVNLIVFDEYVILESTYQRYLKNEMIVLAELLSTIIRSRDDVRVFLLSNAVSYVNPFFEFFEIEPKEGDRFIKIKGGLGVVELIPTSEEFKEEVSKTKLMKLFEGTEYYDYNVNNTVLEDKEEFILKYRPKGRYSFFGSFYSEGMEVSFWYNQDSGIMYVDQIRENNSPHKYYLRIEDMLPSYRYLKEFRKDINRIRTIRKFLAQGDVYYKNQSCKKFVINTVSKFL